MLVSESDEHQADRMNSIMRHALVICLLTGGLLFTSNAHALRCGNKIVRDGMHEAEVLAICGEPLTRRDIGRTLRGHDVYVQRRGEGYPLNRHYYPGYGSTEVVVTEYVYNFGPRKLMRRLVFEGGVLVRIESLGYGFIEEK